MNYLSELPFYGLTDRREFAKAVGSWVYDTVLTLEERDLFENVLESPDKNDQFLNILGNLKIELKYYTIKQSVLIDDTLSWKHQVSYLCTRISRNTGIVGKLRHCTFLLQLKQLYYNLIYPYISYAMTSWGSAFTTQIKKIQTKQNHVIRVMFFATMFGPDTDSALPLLNLLDLLTVTNIYKLQLLNFTHQWHSKKLPNIFNQHFRYASEVHTYNTRYASKSNLYKPRSRTNIGKQTTAAMATEL